MSDYSSDSSVSLYESSPPPPPVPVPASLAARPAPAPTPAPSSICRWRTPRFHDRECSRYFDCPSHIVERALSDDGSNDVGEAPRPVPGNASPAANEATSVGGEVTETRQESDHPEASSTREEVPQPRSEGAGRPEPAPSAEERTPTRPRETPTLLFEDQPGAGSRAGPSVSVSRLQAVPVSSLISESTSAGAASALDPLGAASSAQSSSSHASRRTSASSSSRLAEAAGRSSRALPAAPPPPPPPPHSPATRRSSSSNLLSPRTATGPPEIVLPRWQPDAEVTYCPICHTQFSIFVRKHHCRKCGRVVCNSCSPHRIVIPYQYIVQPPGTPRVGLRYPTSLADGEGEYADFSSLGGGERVRLCNPCVPDPNTTPPQAQGSSAQRPHLRTPSNAGRAFSGDASRRYGTYFPSSPANDMYSRSRSVTMHGAGPSSSSSRPPSTPYLSTQSRILAGTPPSYYPSASTSSAVPTAARHRSMLDVGPSNPPAHVHHHRRSLPPAPAAPQHQIAEEDECPVCHRELPSRTLPNFESLRESHITACIASHSMYSYSAAAAAAAAATAASSSSSGDGDGAGGQGASSSSASSPPPLLMPPPAPRRTGMFPYLATEKDCVDSAECTICLEEFEVGVPMARLECLCRFHRACIAAWFVNHPGRCPVHQHDSFGY